MTRRACLILAAAIASASFWTSAPAQQSTPVSPQAIPAFRDGGPLLGVAPESPAPPYSVRWTYKTSEEDRAGVEGSPTIAGDTVYVADDKGVVHAVSLADGKAKWKYETEDAFATSPLVLNGRVYVGDLTGTMHCISAADGKKVWTVDSGSGIHSSANASVGPAGNRIIFGNDGAEILCLNAEDGKELWRGKAGDRVNAAPAIANGLAYISGCDAMLRAFDLNTGQEKFAVDIAGMAGGSAVIAGDKIVVGTDGGAVLCLSADGKTTHWTYKGIEQQAMVYATVAVDVQNNTVIAGARDRNVHAIDLKTGEKKWTYKTRGDVDASPLISAGRVFAPSKDKKLYVLDLKTGESLWQFTAGRSLDAGPDIDAGVIVVADASGNVYCLQK